ncbi:hypothetical protein KAR91_15260 [Candidatus Pacearchaeota archaeon]|nr:hypothetical protein [Candidatus Pacearchaeota archaeon]
MTATEANISGFLADVVFVGKDGIVREYEIKTKEYDLKKELSSIKFALKSLQDNNKYIEYRKHYAIKHDDPCKKRKHRNYIYRYKGKEVEEWSFLGEGELITPYSPNYFYFVITPNLYDIAIKETKGTPYGIYLVDNGLECIKRPKKLHKEKISIDLLLRFTRRLSFENYNLIQRLL